jgi:hypothetical protein
MVRVPMGIVKIRAEFYDHAHKLGVAWIDGDGNADHVSFVLDTLSDKSYDKNKESIVKLNGVLSGLKS